MAQEMSAMERMLHSLLRAAGFNAQEFAQGISGFITMTQAKLVEMEVKINSTETELIMLNQKLDVILALLQKDAEHGKITGLNGALHDHGANGADGTGGGNESHFDG